MRAFKATIPCVSLLLIVVGAASSAEAVDYVAVDLGTGPAGFTNSSAKAVSAGQQVGSGYYGPITDGNRHALLWMGSAGSCLDLNPAGFAYSEAAGVSDGQQVGLGYGPTTGNNKHALLWTGNASGYVDLNPAAFTASWGSGVSGPQQVGWGLGPTTGNLVHALLWEGSAASYVDLNPAGFIQSTARSVSGGQQVGDGSGPTGMHHALLWTGSASELRRSEPCRVCILICLQRIRRAAGRLWYRDGGGQQPPCPALDRQCQQLCRP